MSMNIITILPCCACRGPYSADIAASLDCDSFPFTYDEQVAYLVVTSLTTGTQWVNGQANIVQWTEDFVDNVNGYDVELVRINVDGLILVAKNGMFRLLSFDGPCLCFDARALSFLRTLRSSFAYSW
jgi:hypothetical protein